MYFTLGSFVVTSIQLALPSFRIKIAPSNRLLILILESKSIPISLGPWGIVNRVELIILFLYRFFLLDGGVLLQLLEIKWFLFSAHYCFLSLHKIVWNVLGTLSLLGFLGRYWFLHVEIIEEVYLLLWLCLSLDRLLLGNGLVLEVAEEISSTIVGNRLFLLDLLLCLPKSRKVRQAKPWELFLFLRLSTMIERIGVSQFARLSERIGCLGIRPCDILELREVQPMLLRITPYFCRKY